MRKIATSQRIKLLLVMFIVAFLLAQSLSLVGAASWSKDKWASCEYGFPEGFAWISWSGYSPLTLERTKVNLYWWNGSSWELKAGATDYDTGSSGYSVAYNSAQVHNGSWQMPANWWGTIVDTTEYAFFSCP